MAYLKGELSRAQILEAATGLIASRGFNAVTIKDILEAAKVTKGKFFHHFSSKEDLFTSLLRDAIQVRRFLDFKEELSACEDKSAFKKLIFLLDRIIAWHQTGLPEVMKLCVYATLFFAPEAPEMVHVRDRLKTNTETIRGLILDAKKAKELPENLDENVLALLFPSASVGGNIINHLTGEKQMTTRNLGEIKKMLIHSNETLLLRK